VHHNTHLPEIKSVAGNDKPNSENVTYFNLNIFEKVTKLCLMSWYYYNTVINKLKLAYY